jgi:hypothetical protein
MTVTLCTSGAVKLKAGSLVSSALTDTDFTELINQAEGWFSGNAQYDWVTNYSGISVIGKAILQDAVSSRAGFFAISNNQSGYSSLEESQVLMDANWTNTVENTNLMRDSKYVEFIKRGTTE